MSCRGTHSAAEIRTSSRNLSCSASAWADHTVYLDNNIADVTCCEVFTFCSGMFLRCDGYMGFSRKCPSDFATWIGYEAMDQKKRTPCIRDCSPGGRERGL